MRNIGEKIEKSFTLKFVLLFVILFFVTAGVSVYFFATFSRSQMRSRMKKDLLESMKAFNRAIESKKSLAFQFAQFISSSESLSLYPGDVERLRSLEIMMTERARVMDFQVDTIRVFQGEEVDDPLVKKGISGVSSTSLTMIGRRGHRFAVVSIAPVLANGEVRKVVRVIYPITKTFLKRQKREVGADITLLYGGITIVTTTSCESCMVFFKKMIGDSENLKQLKEGKFLYFEDECFPYMHSGIVMAYDIGFEEPAFLFLTQDVSQEIAAYRRSILAFAGGVAGYSLLVIIVFAFVARRLVAPVKKLTWMADEIASGRPGVTVDVDRKDEIGALQTRLNEMSVKLKETIDELKSKREELQNLNEELKEAHLEVLEWNKKLEERVREKTVELERMHRKIVEIEKMAAMGKLISGMAHEINNPLAGIVGYAQYAMERLENLNEGGLSEGALEKFREYLRTILDLAMRCSSIVTNFTEFSSAKLDEMDYVNLRELVDQVLSIFETQLKDIGIDIVKKYTDDVSMVYGSTEGLKRVIENIVLNAAEAMPDGGTLTISLMRDAGWVVLEISDTGEGISRELIGKIFDPFFSTREVGKGTGLGLYISYNIVKRHGGDIEVRSEPGKGTTVSVRLPSFAARRF